MNTLPKISIILPSLNQIRFLPERFNSILQQTWTNWELIVVDNYSDDGAWELIQSLATQDNRIHTFQFPRQGLYANWNNGLKLAKGDYIYMATNDDTMTIDCLEKMATALEKYPQCDICHTILTAMDESGKIIHGWWEKNLPARFYGDCMNKLHIRNAPYDGILYCALSTVYLGPLQLLIRRSVFEKIGYFRDDWGSEGDFEWGMRAALVSNTLHLPERLTFWRIHPQQSTSQKAYQSAAQKQRYLDMMESAFEQFQAFNPDFYHKLQPERLAFIYRRQQLRATLKDFSSWLEKLAYILQIMSQYPQFMLQFLYRRCCFTRDQEFYFNYIHQ